MDFELLEDFLSVLEHGSILAAAEAIGASQPTLSRKIRELEDSLGVLLLNRTSRGISPTVYGSLFKQHAETLLRNQRMALDELRALKSGEHGHARIGMAPAFSAYLPDVINKLRSEKPDATFEVIEGTYDTLVQKTLNGEIDGGFTMLPPGESLESLAVFSISSEPIVIVSSPKNPLASERNITLQSLETASWILMNRPRSIIDSFFQIATANGLTSPKVSVETSSLDFLKSMIKTSSLLSMLPSGAVDSEIQHGELKTVDIDITPHVEIAFVHRHGVLAPLVTQIVYEVGEAVKSVTRSSNG